MVCINIYCSSESENRPGHIMQIDRKAEQLCQRIYAVIEKLKDMQERTPEYYAEQQPAKFPETNSSPVTKSSITSSVRDVSDGIPESSSGVSAQVLNNPLLDQSCVQLTGGNVSKPLSNEASTFPVLPILTDSITVLQRLAGACGLLERLAKMLELPDSAILNQLLEVVSELVNQLGKIASANDGVIRDNETTPLIKVQIG